MQAMIDAVCDEIKRNLSAFCEQADLEHLTPESAEAMNAALLAALSAGGVEGYRVFLRRYECEENVIERDGKTLRKKHLSPKEFLTAFGKMTLERIEGLSSEDHRTFDPNFNEPKLAQNLNLVDQLKPIAEELNITLAQLSLFVYQHHKIATPTSAGEQQPK